MFSLEQSTETDSNCIPNEFAKTECFIRGDNLLNFGSCPLEDVKKAGIEKGLNNVSRVYLDLSEARGWWNVKLHINKDLELVFISGHPTRHQPRQLVLPLSSSEMVSPMKINQYLQQIRLEEYETEGLTLAICDSDTTTVYYKVSEGLIQPESPDSADVKRYERYQINQKRRADLDQNVQDYVSRIKRKQENM